MNNKKEPPNGGTLAWLQVVGSFFLFMNSWGLVNTFGVFQTFYDTSLLRNESNSNISWIGSIRAFLLLGSPLFYGPLFDMGYLRLLLGGGTFLIVFGIMMTSLCSELWQLILAQGVCVGLGSGAFFLSGVAIVPTYFTSKKSLAMGISAAGSSIGGVIYPIIFYELNPRLGFGWSVRVIGFIVLAVCMVPLCVLRMRVEPKGRRAVFSERILKDPVFTTWATGWFFGNMGLYVPFFFIQQYATNVVKEPFDIAFWTLPVINAASIFGRIIPGQIADMVDDPVLIIGICTTSSCVLAFCWIAVTSSTAGLFVFCALYGFFSGAFVSLSTPATVSLAPSIDGIGTRLGMFNFIGSLGLLIGNPAAGAIAEKSWPGLQAFAGTAIAISLVLIAALWVRHVRRKDVRS